MGSGGNCQLLRACRRIASRYPVTASSLLRGATDYRHAKILDTYEMTPTVCNQQFGHRVGSWVGRQEQNSLLQLDSNILLQYTARKRTVERTFHLCGLQPTERHCNDCIGSCCTKICAQQCAVAHTHTRFVISISAAVISLIDLHIYTRREERKSNMPDDPAQLTKYSSIKRF